MNMLNKRANTKSIKITVLACTIFNLSVLHAQPAKSQAATTQEIDTAAVVAADQGDLSNVNPADTTEIKIDPAEPVHDPLEGFNRGVFVFNDKIDGYVLKPLAAIYNAVLPPPVNKGIHNFFNNIGNLPNIANDILQLNFFQTSNDLFRLLINSTVGVAGIFDIAQFIGLKQSTNDFGLTLAKWGWKDSTYIVLPFLGPYTVRDGVIGFTVDYYAFSIYPHIYPQRTRYALYGLGVIDRRAQLLQFEPIMEEAAFDKYAFVRDAYMQRRAYQIKQNQYFTFRPVNQNADESRT